MANNREDKKVVSPRGFEPGKITIARTTCNDQDDFIAIEINDEKGCRRSLDIKMSIENFAYAITGRGSIDCNVRRFPVRGKNDE